MIFWDHQPNFTMDFVVAFILYIYFAITIRYCSIYPLHLMQNLQDSALLCHVATCHVSAILHVPRVCFAFSRNVLVPICHVYLLCFVTCLCFALSRDCFALKCSRCNGFDVLPLFNLPSAIHIIVKSATCGHWISHCWPYLYTFSTTCINFAIFFTPC